MIVSHPFLQRVAEAHAAPIMAAHADRLGLTVPEYAQAVSERVRATLEGVPVTVRMTADRLAVFLRVGILPVLHDFMADPRSVRALSEALAFRQTFPAAVTYGRWGDARPDGLEALYGGCALEVRGDVVSLWEGDTLGAAPRTWDGVPFSEWTPEHAPQVFQVLDGWQRDPIRAADELESRGTWAEARVASLSTCPSPLSLTWEADRCPLTHFTREWVTRHPLYIEAHFLKRVRRADVIRAHFTDLDALHTFRPRLEALGIPSHLLNPEVPA